MDIRLSFLKFHKSLTLSKSSLLPVSFRQIDTSRTSPKTLCLESVSFSYSDLVSLLSLFVFVMLRYFYDLGNSIKQSIKEI